ncbi:hypothetical protein GCM10009735_47730 [Actinomadura chokoriensis]
MECPFRGDRPSGARELAQPDAQPRRGTGPIDLRRRPGPHLGICGGAGFQQRAELGRVAAEGAIGPEEPQQPLDLGPDQRKFRRTRAVVPLKVHKDPALQTVEEQERIPHGYVGKVPPAPLNGQPKVAAHPAVLRSHHGHSRSRDICLRSMAANRACSVTAGCRTAGNPGGGSGVGRIRGV